MTVEKDSSSLKSDRLRLMRGILAWEGSIGNTRVRELFSVGLIQASRMLREFRDDMGKAVETAARSRLVVATRPKEIKTDVSLEEYLAVAKDSAANREVLVDHRIDMTKITPHIFALLRQSAVNGTGVEIVYASMANPVPSVRQIYPHTLIQVGRRWHVRAWCAKRGEFRDFNLGRIGKALPLAAKAPKTKADDADWNRTLVLHFIAHRALTPEQQLMVREEFFRGTSGYGLTVCACMAKYVIQDLRAATDPDKQRPPEYQIEVLNTEDLKGVLFEE